MSARINATRVLARRKIFETFISPGFYIIETVGLVLAYFLAHEFVKSIDSAGFNYQLHPIYELIGRSLIGPFGIAFFENLFAEGPFLFILYVSFIPILLYLSISSIFRFGFERKVGAIELFTYGPADGTSYFLASMIKDVLFTIIHIVILILFLAITAGVYNLVLGSSLFLSVFLVFFFSISLYSIGVFASTVSENSATAIVIFLTIVIFFMIILMGSFTIISGYAQNLNFVLSWILKWFSPFFYLEFGLKAVGAGYWDLYVLSMMLSMVFAGIMLFFSHLIFKKKGVRA
jgi:hypothetical protein